MKFEIVPLQASTIRGAVWVVFGVIGIIGYWMGKDPMPLMAMAGIVAGGLGVAVKD